MDITGDNIEASTLEKTKTYALKLRSVSMRSDVFLAWVSSCSIGHTNRVSLIFSSDPTNRLAKTIGFRENLAFSSREFVLKFFLSFLFKLHLAALTSYKGEIVQLKSRLEELRHERNILRSEQVLWKIEKQKIQREYYDKSQSQVSTRIVFFLHLYFN